MNRNLKLIIIVLCLLLSTLTLTACSHPTPTLGLAPSKARVEKAIMLQVQQTQQQLTEQLESSLPKMDITQVRLKQLEPLLLGGLPTYRIQGTYHITVKLPHRKATQANNIFDIYLQRQKEGKTWRLAIPERMSKGVVTQWRTYRIP